MIQVIDSDEITQPSRPPGLIVVQLAVVEETTVPFDRRDGMRWTRAR